MRLDLIMGTIVFAICWGRAGPAAAAACTAPNHADAQALAPADAAYRTPEGRVRVVGYNDMAEMLDKLGAIFERKYPGIAFEWRLNGTRAAPGPLIDGSSAFAPMGAEFGPAHFAAWRQVHDADPLAVPVAHDSLTPGALSSPTGIFVHASNPLRSISVDMLRRVLAPLPGEARIRLWRELGVLGAAGGRPIRPVGLAEDTAIGALMLRRLQADGYVPEFDARRQSRDVVAAVADTRDALGIANLNHAGPGIRALVIIDRSGREIAGDIDGIRSGLYPFDRHLLIYVRRDANECVEAMAHAFLCLALSPEGQRVIAEGSRGYLPLNPIEIDHARSTIGGCQ
ncbi:MAG TPA: substrate-binding domain-containing protein [Rhodocyclaceae bacterium]|nr:substrate-binding domain-containing protein [Rhodocyclaceae bacterium]